MNNDLPGKPDTFAIYLVKQYLARKGYRAGVPPEAHALEKAATYTLVYSDRVALNVLCIVDREANPQARFELSDDEVRAVGLACQKYTGRIGRSKVPVTIKIVETGGGFAPQEIEALRHVRSKYNEGVLIQKFLADTAQKKVHGSLRFKSPLLDWAYIEKLMQGSRESDADLHAASRPSAMKAATPPVLTIGMLALLAAIYVCETLFPQGGQHSLFGPDTLTLLTFGALNKRLVLENHEWYRVMAAAFLHGNILHIALNGFALYFGGFVLENLVGRVWFVALYMLGIVGGYCMSLVLNAPNIVTVGASGAIMALFACAYACSYRFPPGASRAEIQRMAMGVLIPSMLPLLAVAGMKTDIAAHIGGVITGGLMGALLLKIWPKDQLYPGFRDGAGLIALAGTGACTYALAVVLKGFGVI